MHKLIEIPIYALDKSTLLVRYEKYVEALRGKIFPNIKEEVFQRYLEIEVIYMAVVDYKEFLTERHKKIASLMQKYYERLYFFEN